MSNHDWTLWVPMDDGTDRFRRSCRDCELMQTARSKYEFKDYD